jgi:Flp pilus assembly pilin Flp
MKRSKRGQSTLEYVIILAVVIGAVIVIAKGLKTRLTSSYDTLGTTMETKVKSVSF